VREFNRESQTISTLLKWSETDIEKRLI
jgi:hypothetical protein